MKWLLAWRQRLGLTQVQLGNKSGIDSNMISRYERNTATPSLDNVERLALGLGITVDELLNGPSDGKCQLVVSWNWDDFKEGVINMNDNKFQLVLGPEGQIALTGAALFPSRKTIDDFVARVREQIEIAYDAQVKRGAIKEATAEV